MYTIPQRTGDEQAKFDEFERKIFATLHCADIGTITAVDSGTGYLTVKPIVKERIVDSTGKTSYSELPEIPDTPYLAISGSTPSVGQSVLIIYCDRDFSGWLKQGGTNASGTVTAQNPEILSYHSLNHAVAIAGFGANSNIVPFVSYGTIISSTSATDIGVSQALVDLIKSWEGFVDRPYDDAYLSVSEGCCVMHRTFVIDASTQKKCYAFKNTEMVWATNQNRIIYATVDESIKPVVETELSGSAELMCYNAATKQKTTIISPNPKYLYNPIPFDGTGNRLIYYQTDLKNDDKYELTLNIPLHNQTSSSS